MRLGGSAAPSDAVFKVKISESLPHKKIEIASRLYRNCDSGSHVVNISSHTTRA